MNTGTIELHEVTYELVGNLLSQRKYRQIWLLPCARDFEFRACIKCKFKKKKNVSTLEIGRMNALKINCRFSERASMSAKWSNLTRFDCSLIPKSEGCIENMRKCSISQSVTKSERRGMRSIVVMSLALG